MALRPRLEPIAKALLDASQWSMSITIDAIGDAIGTVAVSTDDVDALLDVLERAGRAIVAPEGQRGVANLQKVLAAVRELAARGGKKPTIPEIAAHTGIGETDVRHALALGRVMGR
jgi:hypothetical protein